MALLNQVIDDNPGYKIIIAGDFNFPCRTGDKGYDAFLPLANDLGLMSCDDMDQNNVGFTYHHESIGHKSFIDHFFVYNELQPKIKSFKILEKGDDLSDHLPITLCLSFSSCIRANTGVIPENVVHEFRWDKGDIHGYCQHSGTLLSNIVHEFPCMQCGTNCTDKSCHLNIEIYYSEIVHCLMEALRLYIPKIPSSALKHYWSPALDDLKNDSIFAHSLWKSAGRPQSGFCL